MNDLNDFNGLRPLKIGLVSISDRASSGVYADEGYPRCKTGSRVRCKTRWCLNCV